MTGISVRKAASEDSEAIAEISRGTWDGEDYLEGRASEWTDDGTLHVGELDGTVVGTFRISPMPDGVLWLEALRILAGFRGRGLGRQLAGAAFGMGRRLIEQGRGRALEFSTYVNNHESIHISTSQGFRLVDGFMLMTREGFPASSGLESCIPSPGMFRETREHIPCGWKYPRACPEGIEWALRRCEGFRYNGVVFLRKRGSGEATPLDGSVRNPPDFLRGAEAAAAAAGSGEVSIVVHESRRDLITAAFREGYSTWEPVSERNVLVFRYPA
ncbi:MAG: GNAT family N-acetyltransferase [Candidatus Aegiribacteria sp.]